MWTSHVAVLGFLLLSQVPASAPIKVGQLAPSVLATSLDGAKVEIAPSGKSIVLYVVAPGCGWCVSNAANLSALHASKGREYRFLGLSLKEEGLTDLLKEAALPFEVHVASAQTIAEYGLGTTPSTIVIGADGRVVQKWNGAFVRSQSAVEAFFRIKLPGLRGAVDLERVH